MGSHSVPCYVCLVIVERSKLPPIYKTGLSFSFLNKVLLINNTPDNRHHGETSVSSTVF